MNDVEIKKNILDKDENINLFNLTRYTLSQKLKILIFSIIVSSIIFVFFNLKTDEYKISRVLSLNSSIQISKIEDTFSDLDLNLSNIYIGYVMDKSRMEVELNNLLSEQNINLSLKELKKIINSIKLEKNKKYSELGGKNYLNLSFDFYQKSNHADVYMNSIIKNINKNMLLVSKSLIEDKIMSSQRIKDFKISSSIEALINENKRLNIEKQLAMNEVDLQKNILNQSLEFNLDIANELNYLNPVYFTNNSENSEINIAVNQGNRPKYLDGSKILKKELSYNNSDTIDEAIEKIGLIIEVNKVKMQNIDLYSGTEDDLNQIKRLKNLYIDLNENSKNIVFFDSYENYKVNLLGFNLIQELIYSFFFGSFAVILFFVFRNIYLAKLDSI